MTGTIGDEETQKIYGNQYFDSKMGVQIYIKDKELIGFDSASSTVFEFNLWRLKNFGVTQNFIYFNDDCFVGNYYFIVNQQNTPPLFSLLHKAEPQRFSPNKLQSQSHAAIRRSGFLVLNFMFN